MQSVLEPTQGNQVQRPALNTEFQSQKGQHVLERTRHIAQVVIECSRVVWRKGCVVWRKPDP